MGENVADVLERAADLIAAPGAWIQRAYGEPGGCRFCAVGAIRAAIGETSALRTENWFEQHVAKLVGKSVGEFEDWNDAKRRTQDEVVAKLREAAAKARAEQVPA